MTPHEIIAGVLVAETRYSKIDRDEIATAILSALAAEDYEVEKRFELRLKDSGFTDETIAAIRQELEAAPAPPPDHVKELKR